jgi:hypothetical protein
MAIRQAHAMLAVAARGFLSFFSVSCHHCTNLINVKTPCAGSARGQILAGGVSHQFYFETALKRW